MAISRVRSYYDGPVTTDRPIEEIEKEIKHWDDVSDKMNNWIDPDLEQ